MSVSANFDDFRSPVEGAMKLLRACSSYFRCIINLAQIIELCKYVFCIHEHISMNLATLRKVLWVIWTYGDGVWLLSAVAVPKCGWNWAWSGGQISTVLSILSSKDMCYELNATIILDWCSNLMFLLDLLAWAQWTIRSLEHKEFIANIS